jgi:hypothetical protein
MSKIKSYSGNKAKHTTEYIKRYVSWGWFLGVGFFLGVMAATAIFKGGKFQIYFYSFLGGFIGIAIGVLIIFLCFYYTQRKNQR